MQVQVQRRETERQAEQRVNSYAYIARQEADEKWKQLNCASADSSVAGSLWDRLMTPPAETASLASMPRASYLSALTSGRDQNLICTAVCRCYASLICRNTAHTYMAKSVSCKLRTLLRSYSFIAVPQSHKFAVFYQKQVRQMH